MNRPCGSAAAVEQRRRQAVQAVQIGESAKDVGDILRFRAEFDEKLHNTTKRILLKNFCFCLDLRVGSSLSQNLRNRFLENCRELCTPRTVPTGSQPRLKDLKIGL